jgi:hypothetical protein
VSGKTVVIMKKVVGRISPSSTGTAAAPCRLTSHPS